MALPPLQPATVTALTRLSSDFLSLQLSFAPGTRPAFLPGQYLFLSVPGHDKPVLRAYSIATPPGLPDTLELIIRIVPEGKACTYIQTLQAGDTIQVRLPFGHMTLAEDATTPLLLIGVGSGVAPLYSIIRHLAARDFPRTVTAYLGFRHSDHAAHVEELQRLAAESEGRFTVTFCIDEVNTRADFVDGRVTPFAEDWTDLTATTYLCGIPAMVDSVAAILIAKGMPKEQIQSEKY